LEFNNFVFERLCLIFYLAKAKFKIAILLLQNSYLRFRILKLNRKTDVLCYRLDSLVRDAHEIPVLLPNVQPNPARARTEPANRTTPDGARSGLGEG